MLVSERAFLTWAYNAMTQLRVTPSFHLYPIPLSAGILFCESAPLKARVLRRRTAIGEGELKREKKMIRGKGITTYVFDSWNSSISAIIAAIPLRNLRSCSWSSTHLCSSSRSWVRSRSFLGILPFLVFVIISGDSVRGGEGRGGSRKGCGSIWNGRWKGDRRPYSGRGGEGTTNVRCLAR